MNNRNQMPAERIHDGAVTPPAGCPRQRTDCTPLARVSSPQFESFMCCGETASAPVPTDRLRLCVRSTHKHGVDVLVNFDERDATDTAYVLLGGLSAFAQDLAAAADALTDAIQISANANDSVPLPSVSAIQAARPHE
jgi:hypothetical protein